MSQGQLNKNNFLRWFGEFEEAEIANVANDDAGNGAINTVSFDILPLDNDTSTLGIDANTFFFTSQVYTSKPATWNPITKKVTFYTIDTSVPGDYELKYKWKDVQSNLSNEATIVITLTARATAFRGHGATTCILDGDGHKTGFAGYTQLEQYYTDNGAKVIPEVLKANDPDDDDYIEPVNDPVKCSTFTYVQITMAYADYSHGGTIQAACANLTGGVNLRTVYVHSADISSGDLPVGTVLYSDSALTTTLPISGWYAYHGYSYTVGSDGIITFRTPCM